MQVIKQHWKYAIIGVLSLFIVANGVLMDKKVKRLVESSESASIRIHEDSIYIVDLIYDLEQCDSLIGVDKGEILAKLKEHSARTTAILLKWREEGKPDIPAIPEDLDSQQVLFLKLIGEYE